MTWALSLGISGVLVCGFIGYAAGRWGPPWMAWRPLVSTTPEPFYPLTIFGEGGLDERVPGEVVASTLHPVPRGVPGCWDTADLVAVPLLKPGAVLVRVGGKWRESSIYHLPLAGDPLRRCVEAAASESTGWRDWLNSRLKRQ